MVVLVMFFRKKYMSRDNSRIFCLFAPWSCMNTWIYLGMIFIICSSIRMCELKYIVGFINIANEGRHDRIGNYHLYLEMEYNQPNCSNTGVPLVEQGLLVLPEHLSSSRSLVFCEVLCILLFVLFLMAIALSVLRRVTYLDYPFGIFKLS